MIRVVIWALAAAWLSACASGKIDTGYPFPNEPGAPVSKEGKFGPAPLREMQVALADLIEYRLLNDGVPVADTGPGLRVPRAGEARLDQLIAAVRQAKHPQQVRNDVVSAWVAASTANCSVYTQALRSGQVTARLASDFFAGGFAVASTLTSPIRNANLLSGLSAFSTAEGASVDRDIFAQQGAELVADAIVQLRTTDLTKIQSKMRLEYDDWPMAMAMSDLFAFHGDCTMLRGFSRMRDALLTREQTIQAIRAAAAGVAKNGGSPQQVAAVISAMDASDATAPTPPPAWNADLLKAQTAAGKCLVDLGQTIEAKVTAGMTAVQVDAAFADLAEKVFGKGGGCPADPTWANMFNVVAQKAATDALTGLGAKIVAEDAKVQAAKGDAAPKAKAERDAVLTDAVSTAHDSFLVQTDDAASKVAEIRGVAMTRLENWAGGTAQQVVDALTGLQGTDLVNDPVFNVALANARQVVATQPQDGELAAKQALAAAKARVAG